MSQATPTESSLSIHCPNCRRKTKHTQMFSEETREFDEEIQYLSEWQVVRCRGCDGVQFRLLTWCSEDLDESGEVVEREELFPRSLGHRALMEDALRFLPVKVYSPYRETVSALNANLTGLAAIGIRATVEQVAAEQRSAGSNLETRIDDLAAKGLVGRPLADSFHTLRFLGNDAAHEFQAPPLASLRGALDALETLLKTIYLVPRVTRQLDTRRARSRAVRPIPMPYPYR